MIPEHAKAEIDAIVTELVVQWARNQLRGKPVPRRNRRIVLGDRQLAQRVGEALRKEATSAGWFAVATSADEEAVLWRNESPPLPPGISEDTPLVYLVFWCEAEQGHEQNAQSLRDLTEVEIADLLALDGTDELALEARIRARCREAAQVWSDKAGGEASAAQLDGAWGAMRSVLRTGRGGRDSNLPFVEHLDRYARWLWRAFIADSEWTTIPAEDRPASIVRRWGQALPELGLFGIPALASVLGIPVAPDARPAKKGVAAAWSSRLHELLAENQAASVDFGALEDQIAGKLSVEVRLAQEKRVSLSQDDPQSAKEALIRFCRGDDEEALERVEWLFHEKPDDRRSASHGLKGLLIARNASGTRMSPLDRAYEQLRDTLTKLCGQDVEAQAKLTAFTELLRERIKSDSRLATGVAHSIREFAARQLPTVPGLEVEVRAALAKAAAAAELDPTTLVEIADSWERLGRVDEKPVRAPTLLLGLARLLLRRVAERQRENVPLAVGNGTLILAAKDVKHLELKGDDWRQEARRRLSVWLGEVIAASADEDTGEDPALESAEDDVEELVVSVSFRREQAESERLGDIILEWSHTLVRSTEASASVSAWTMEDAEARGFRAQHLLQILKPHHQSSLGGLFQDVELAFKKYLHEVTTGAHSALAHVLGPLPSEAREWVDAWNKALGFVDVAGANAAAVLARLRTELEQSIDDEDLAMAKKLREEIRMLQQKSVPSLPSPKDVRPLLQACTAELKTKMGGVTQRHLVLLPHHPLVLRPRVVAEEVLCECLRVMASGWPPDGLSDLENALESWGAPEPQHLYGWWDGPPLVFDEWLADYGIALFGPFDDQDAADAGRQGIREAGRVINRYCRLFPAAADRLAIRIHADHEGRWANRLIDLIGRSPDLAALHANLDVEGVRDRILLTRESWRQPERRFLLEMQDDGTEPRIRLRGHPQSPSDAHIAFVVGETIKELKPTIEMLPPGPARGSAWGAEILFQTTEPELLQSSFHVADPPDPLCRRVAIAIGYARSEKLLAHVERYSFDETKVKEPIRSLHATAHWLSLSSRRPLYRAVQAAGEDVATLLDFRTTWERGRPLHVCVSISTGEMRRDLHRFTGVLRVLLGNDVHGLPEAVIRMARRFAPGFAINCAGAPSPAAVEGLLGLLLTAEAVRSDRGAGSLILALDQHQRLLERRGDDTRSDILSLGLAADGAIELAVAESKLTLNAASPKGPVIARATVQVQTTLDRLKRLAVSHPLSSSVHAELRAALVEHIHMAVSTKAQADAVGPFLDALTDTGCSVRFAPNNAEIHVWSLSKDTSAESPEIDGVRIVVHDRAMTLEGIAHMATRTPTP